jgi:hypothetical protein
MKREKVKSVIEQATNRILDSSPPLRKGRRSPKAGGVGARRWAFKTGDAPTSRLIVPEEGEEEPE